MCPRPTSLISTTIPSKTPVETALLPNGVGVNVLTGTNKSPLCPFGHLYPPNPSSTCGLATKIEPVFCWQCPPFPPSRDGYGSLKGRACQEDRRGKVEEGREREVVHLGQFAFQFLSRAAATVTAMTSASGAMYTTANRNLVLHIASRASVALVSQLLTWLLTFPNFPKVFP